MKEPINPIPRDLSLDVKHTSEGIEDGGEEPLITPAISNRANSRVDRPDAAYHWLLITSLILTSIMCWLYVTKPVIVQNGASNDVQRDGALPGSMENSQSGRVSTLVPSEYVLPGSKLPSSVDRKISSQSNLQQTGSGALAESGHMADNPLFSQGWESTNLKMQHIFSADTGGDEMEEIVLDVPVLYETRTMRWSVADIAQARQLMQRLIVYEGNLKNLRNDGKEILKEWNELIENTTPTDNLKADSPSLPKNHVQGEPSDEPSAYVPASSSVIKNEP